MEDVKIILSATWVALMLTYLLGDVLRIYAGDFKPGRNSGQENNPESIVGNRDTNDDSDSHGLPFPDAELSGEPLGKYHRSDSLLWFQPPWTPYLPFQL
jgi:hypothetical protein